MKKLIKRWEEEEFRLMKYFHEKKVGDRGAKSKTGIEKVIYLS